MSFIQLNKSAFIRPKKLICGSDWLGHIPFAGWLAEELNPRIFVELGSQGSGSYLAFCQAFAEYGADTFCYSVDAYEGDRNSNLYDESAYAELAKYHDENYAIFSKRLSCSFDEALSEFVDGTVDLLHIDGLHTYEAVKHNFEAWLPKMSSRGVVLFHDTFVRGNEFGVWKFWSRIASKFPSFELEHSNGLGVLLVGNEMPASLGNLVRCLADEVVIVRSLFFALGRGVILTSDQEQYVRRIEAFARERAASEVRRRNIEELARTHREQIERLERSHDSVNRQLRVLRSKELFFSDYSRRR